MSKFDKYLDPGESIVLESSGQPSLYFPFMFLTIVSGVLFVGLTIFAILASPDGRIDGNSTPLFIRLVGGVGSIAFILAFVSFLVTTSRYESACYAITNKRVMCKCNIFGGDRFSEVPIYSITAFNIKEWGGGGTVELKSIDGTYFTLFFVKSPFDIRRQIIYLQELSKFKNANQNLPK